MPILFVEGWFKLPDDFAGSRADAMRALADYDEKTPDPPVGSPRHGPGGGAARALASFDAGYRMHMRMSVEPVERWRSFVDCRNPITTNVGTCARCGGDHEGLTFLEMHAPSDEFTHWSRCPTNGEPILLRTMPAESGR